MSDLADLDREYRTKERTLTWFFGERRTHIETFDDLVKSVDRRFPDAKQGRPMAVADTGEEYVEIYRKALCRSNEFDVRLTKKSVLEQFRQALQNYVSDNDGVLYWRIRLEEDLIDAPQVLRYADDGPDKEFITGKRCYVDPDWQCYQIYCRLLRSDKPSLTGDS